MILQNIYKPLYLQSMLRVWLLESNIPSNIVVKQWSWGKLLPRRVIEAVQYRRRRRHVAKYSMCLNSYALCVNQSRLRQSRHFWSKMTQSGFGDAIWVWWRKVTKNSFCVDGGRLRRANIGTSIMSTGSFILRRRGQIASCRRKVGLVTQSGFGDVKNIFGHPTQFASLDPN